MNDGKDDMNYSDAQNNRETEEVPELTEEESRRQAEQVQKVHILCQLAESHLEDLDDDYEWTMLNERINKAVTLAKEIQDPFYYSAALHPVVILTHKAGWKNKAEELLEMVSDRIVKERIAQELGG